MKPSGLNVERAKQLVGHLRAGGVCEFVVCSGSRNSPIILTLLKTPEVTLHTHFEERAAGFFALGRCGRSRSPVAVVVTSGTAVCELLPAVVEAHYQRRPLIVVSADRPPQYAGTGAPQSLPQMGIFSHFAPSVGFDTSVVNESLSELRGPLHINIDFDEPLIDGPVGEASHASEVERAELKPASKTSANSPPSARRMGEGLEVAARFENPLLIVSGLELWERDLVREGLQKGQGPAWIEATSGLMNHPDLKDRQVRSGETFLKTLPFDGVIRVGDVPTCRYWRDLESSNLPVVSFTNRQWPGLARPSYVEPLSSWPSFSSPDSSHSWRARDGKISVEIDAVLNHYSASEPSFVRRLGQLVASEDHIYLGNSMPIREWDQFSRSHCHADVTANRGMNGIDGQIASFFGWQSPGKNYAVLGDLTTLYDLTSLTMAKSLTRDANLGSWQLIVLNNGGGQIFRRLYQEVEFRNPHSLRFTDIGDFFDIPSRTFFDSCEVELGQGLMELVIDETQDRKCWQELEALF